MKSLINKTLRTLFTAVSRGFISSSKDNVLFKGPFFDLRDILAAESPLKMMKNFFYFMLKALFVLKVAWYFAKIVTSLVTVLLKMTLRLCKHFEFTKKRFKPT